LVENGEEDDEFEDDERELRDFVIEKRELKENVQMVCRALIRPLNLGDGDSLGKAQDGFDLLDRDRMLNDSRTGSIVTEDSSNSSGYGSRIEGTRMRFCRWTGSYLQRGRNDRKAMNLNKLRSSISRQ
jgi:hypothetical protein